MSNYHQRRLKKELETLIIFTDPSTNPNWDQKSGDNSSLESEWSNLDSDSVTVAANSESNFDKYLDNNQNNSVVLDISHSCLVFLWSSDGIPTRKYHGVTSEEFFWNILHSFGTPQEGSGRYSNFRGNYAQSAAGAPTGDF